MSEITQLSPTLTARHNRIRMRTMIMLRWVAIIGQIVAITVAQMFFGLQLETSLCFLLIGISVISNLVATFTYPESKRLSETENLFMVLFDLLQLSFLLYLTGGLHNPFSMLLLGPVTASAAALSLRSSLAIGLVSLVIVTLLSRFYVPLQTEDGFILRIPTLFIFGNWVGLVIALIFLGAYARKISDEMHTMGDALQATYLALSREQKLTDIGGVVAAAAHELGTPLATIKLTSAELMEDLADRPDLAEDAALIRSQAERCKDILASMGRAGKDDLLFRKAPFETVLEYAAEPHLDRGKDVIFENAALPGESLPQPHIMRRPEIIHGLRNLIQNAVDFSHKTVWIESDWSEESISVRIMDDGKGFPPHLLGRIGDPFMRRRRSEKDKGMRPEYEGMGLGLFIAKTLLERSGANLTFTNGSNRAKHRYQPRQGAIVEVIWDRRRIDAKSPENHIPLGENQSNPSY